MTSLADARSSLYDPLVAQAALDGLLRPQKTLPAWLFYDDAGCRLFQRITELPEYYLTRTEHALLAETMPALRAYLSARCDRAALVEFGTSDERKAGHLLAIQGADEARLFRAYTAIAVDGPGLAMMKARMARAMPDVAVRTVPADFEAAIVLPPGAPGLLPVGLFAGSTIGNFDPGHARDFLRRAARTLGPDSALLVGFDLRKDPAVLVPAYADAAGVTAAFNLNLLTRLNREAAANFDVAAFDHRAVWNDAESRIEMHLVSRWTQQVYVAGYTIAFDAGAFIHTENSYKYTTDDFCALSRAAGWQVRAIWSDKQERFALGLLDRPAI